MKNFISLLLNFFSSIISFNYIVYIFLIINQQQNSIKLWLQILLGEIQI